MSNPDPVEVWNAIIDQASSRGEGSLSVEQRCIYLVNLFLIEMDNGGLAGFLYNISPDAGEPTWQRLRDTAESVRSFGRQHVAEELIRLANLLENPSARDAETTWGDYLLARGLTDDILEQAQAVAQMVGGDGEVLPNNPLKLTVVRSA